MVWLAIASRFGLDAILPAQVKEADNRILLTERNALMSRHGRWAADGVLDPLPVPIIGWAPAEAEHRYLARLHELEPAELVFR